jgi:hypothetical protein
MIPVSNAYETECLVRDHMRDGLREVHQDRRGRSVVRKPRRGLLNCIFAKMGWAAHHPVVAENPR